MRHQCVTCQVASERPHQCEDCAQRAAAASLRSDLIDAIVDAGTVAVLLAVGTLAVVVLG